MGYLKKISKKREKQPKNSPVSTRLTESEFKQFSKLCEETGYSVAEALRLLVLLELNNNDDDMNTKSIQTYSNSNQDELKRTQVEAIRTQTAPKEVQTVNKPKRTGVQVSSTRFTTNPWKVKEELPCPICGTWITASNFSRHAKKFHEMTTQEVFTIHKDKATQMAAEHVK